RTRSEGRTNPDQMSRDATISRLMLPIPALTLLTLSLPIVLAGCPPTQEDRFEPNVPPVSIRAGTSNIRVTVVTDGLEHPWGLAFLPGDEGILVTERPGRLRLISGGQLRAEPIEGLPAIRGEGEGGLLD